MKKFLLIISFLLVSFIGFSQNPAEIHFPNNGYSWQQVGNSCSGCSSFFIGAVKSEYPNEFGNFRYTIYLQTNSRDLNGQLRLTHISGIRYTYYDVNLGQWISPDNYSEYWALVENTPSLAYTLYSKNANLYIKIAVRGYVYR